MERLKSALAIAETDAEAAKETSERIDEVTNGFEQASLKLSESSVTHVGSISAFAESAIATIKQTVETARAKIDEAKSKALDNMDSLINST